MSESSLRFIFIWMIFSPGYLASHSLVDRTMKTLARLLLMPVTLLILSQECWAHAFVDHAEPAVGSQIHSVPTQVKIWFTEKLEPALSKIQVFDSSGTEIDRHDSKIDQSNGALLTISIPELTEPSSVFSPRLLSTSQISIVLS